MSRCSGCGLCVIVVKSRLSVSVTGRRMSCATRSPTCHSSKYFPAIYPSPSGRGLRRLAGLPASRSWVRGLALTIARNPSSNSAWPLKRQGSKSFSLGGEGVLLRRFDPHQQRFDLHLRPRLRVEFGDRAVEQIGRAHV